MFWLTCLCLDVNNLHWIIGLIHQLCPNDLSSLSFLPFDGFLVEASGLLPSLLSTLVCTGVCLCVCRVSHKTTEIFHRGDFTLKQVINLAFINEVSLMEAKLMTQ